MSKRFWSILIAGALISSVFTVGSATAQTPTAVPATVNIEDIKGDSNGLNDQNDGATFGDNAGGVTVGSADLLKVWFTTTDKLNVHILTSLPAGGGNFGINYRVFFNGTCHAFQGNVGGKTNADAPSTAVIRDLCVTTPNVEGEIVVETLEDKTGLTTLSFPLGAWPGVEMGATLSAPSARTRLILVDRTVPQLDTTKKGTDYTISSGGAPADPPANEEPPAGEDPPKEPKEKKECKKQGKGKGKDKGKGKGKAKGKNKGCKNGKGPKGPKEPKGPVAATCAPYVPGEKGAEAETTVVTEKATEDAPIVIDVPLGPAAGNLVGPDTTTRMKHNVQLDIPASEGGLFAKLESPGGDDPDLYVYWDNDKQAAVAGGFNPLLVAGPLPGPVNDRFNANGTGSGGHSAFTYEQIDGLRTGDCGGWTLDLVNWAGRGGTYKLKLWVGEIMNDPAPRD